MIGLGSNRLTVCRRGGMRVTQAGRGGMEWLGVRGPSWSSPYSAQATAALLAQFPTQWPTIRDYGLAHPEIVPYVNANYLIAPYVCNVEGYEPNYDYPVYTNTAVRLFDVAPYTNMGLRSIGYLHNVTERIGDVNFIACGGWNAYGVLYTYINSTGGSFGLVIEHQRNIFTLTSTVYFEKNIDFKAVNGSYLFKYNNTNYKSGTYTQPTTEAYLNFSGHRFYDSKCLQVYAGATEKMRLYAVGEGAVWDCMNHVLYTAE